MKANIMMAGCALVGTIIAGLTGGVPRTAHADTSIYTHARCYYCAALAPSIELSSTRLNEIDYTKPDGEPGSYYTLTVFVKGSSFPQGDPVHVALEYNLPDGMTTPDGAPLSVGPYIAASTDTQASFGGTFPLGNGQVFHVEAGRISTVFTAAAVCSNLDTPNFPFQVVATDLATGTSYATPLSDSNRLWTNCDFQGTISY